MRGLPGGLARLWRRLVPHRAGAPPRARTGRRGEREAAHHLKRAGYRILTRNYAITEGEIDLIAFRDGVVVFVEVRTQTQPAPFDALHTITRPKQKRIIRAAHSYASLNRLHETDAVLRFDVVAVLVDESGRPLSVTHVENAFQETPSSFT